MKISYVYKFIHIPKTKVLTGSSELNKRAHVNQCNIILDYILIPMLKIIKNISINFIYINKPLPAICYIPQQTREYQQY